MLISSDFSTNTKSPISIQRSGNCNTQDSIKLLNKTINCNTHGTELQGNNKGQGISISMGNGHRNFLDK